MSSATAVEPGPTAKLRINAGRLDALARVGAIAGGGVCRLALTQEDRHGRDAQMLARICPAAMIFVPSVGGISHNVKVYTAPADLEAGANVLLHTLLRLAA